MTKQKPKRIRPRLSIFRRMGTSVPEHTAVINLVLSACVLIQTKARLPKLFVDAMSPEIHVFQQ